MALSIIALYHYVECHVLFVVVMSVVSMNVVLLTVVAPNILSVAFLVFYVW